MVVVLLGPILVLPTYCSVDSFFFCWANVLECTKFKHLLTVYVKASGQVVNYQKSDIFYSPNTTDDKSEVLYISGVNRSFQHGRYLDMPSIIDKNKK